jgi:hypothetical protein
LAAAEAENEDLRR